MSGAARPLRVLMVTPRYLPEIGGVERHVHEVATRFAATPGVEVRVLTTDREGRLPAHDHDGAVEVRRVRAHPRQTDWMLAPGLPAAITGEHWDVMHLQSYHTFVAPTAMATAARTRLPYVVTFHGGGSSGRRRHQARGLQRRALRPLLARAAALVAVAQFEIDEYAAALQIGVERFVLIPNGVDLAPAPDVGDGSSTPSGLPLLASVGRLERYKGHHRVLAALPHVIEQEPAARLWIGGSGPFESELRRQAEALGVADRVEISAVPPEDRDEMARRLSRSDLVVLLSEFETHPIAALEALSLGRPLLVAGGSGLGELTDRGLARAIDVNASPEAVAAAIVRELREPLVRAPATLPSWDGCAAALLALYRRIARAAA